jgi:hypothetical protein
MYNRYIPGADGSYRCERIQTPPEPQPEAITCTPETSSNNQPVHSCRSFGKIETGDLLVLAILALLLLDGEGDQLIVLIAAIAFLFF